MTRTPRNRTYVIAAVVGLSSLLLAACGSGDEAAAQSQAVVDPTATPQIIQVTPAPTAAATATPDNVEDERTEDEQAIFELWDAQRVNFFNQQYDRFLVGCPPEFKKPVSEIEAEIKRDLAERGWIVSNMSYSQPEITLMSSITALTEFSILVESLDHDDHVHQQLQIRESGFYTKIDDTWYRDCETSVIASSPTHTPAKIKSL